MLNAAICALGAALGVVMGVVCILYLANLDVEPRLRSQLPLLFAGTAGFLALGAAGGVAFAAHRREWGLRWLLQGLPALPVAAVAAFLIVLRG